MAWASTASPGAKGRSSRRGVSRRSTPSVLANATRLARMGVLRLRDFRLLLAAQAVSWLGDRMVPIALAFAVLELGGSASEVGIVLAARTLPLVATLLLGGVVADRFSRRSVMVLSDLSRVVTQGLTAVLLIAGAAHVWELAVL